VKRFLIGLVLQTVKTSVTEKKAIHDVCIMQDYEYFSKHQVIVLLGSSSYK
jgi:hypothetical protein